MEVIPREQWPSLAVSSFDHNFQNSLSYAEAMAKHTGSTVRFVKVLKGGRSIGLAAVRLRTIPVLNRGVAYVSDAPLVLGADGEHTQVESYLASADALREQLVTREGHILLLRPPMLPDVMDTALHDGMLNLGFRLTSDIRSYRTVAVSLTAGEEDMRRRLHQKWRNCLNQSQRASLEIQIGTGPVFAERFLAIHRAMRDVKDFDSTIDPAFFLRMNQEDTGTRILIATSGERDVGGHVLSLLGTTGVYLFGATNEQGRDTRAGYLLQWEAMRLCKAAGCRWYDLGGIDEIANPGGFQFKTRMGGAIVSASGPYKVVPHGLSGTLLDRLLVIYARRRRRKALAPVSVG